MLRELGLLPGTPGWGWGPMCPAVAEHNKPSGQRERLLTGLQEGREVWRRKGLEVVEQGLLGWGESREVGVPPAQPPGMSAQ